MAYPRTTRTPGRKTSSLGETFGLLKDKIILLLFVGIIFVVGIDVGLNTTVPKLLIENLILALNRLDWGQACIL